MGGWDGRMSCTESLLRSGRIPNGELVLEQGGASMGRGMEEWKTSEDGWGGVSPCDVGVGMEG